MVFFLKLKKILMLFTLALFFFGTSCQASRHNEFDDENCHPRTLIKRCNVFSCLLGGCLDISTPLYYKEISSELEASKIEGIANIESHTICILPYELLYQVAVYLSPLDIINLIKSNKHFICLSDNYFWQYYNKEHNYSSWNDKITAVKVAFSYYWFKNNSLRRAAVLGFPKARAFLKQQEELRKENPQSYKNARYTTFYEHMRRKFFYKKRY